MCTAISFKNRYFGRTLDYEISFGEQVVITPAQYPFEFRRERINDSHYAMIGIARVQNNYPLYFDAFNEKGLAMAGLNFVGNAHYFSDKAEMINLAPYELIPWILSTCATVSDAKTMLKKINLVNIPFDNSLPLSPLHWMISDQKDSITIESMEDGLRTYDNHPGVLTNNPPFPAQIFNLNNYIHLSNDNPVNNFLPNLNLNLYSRGMGGLGLPGDLSSMSRFVRVTFVKSNSVCDDHNSVSQFFHILGSVEQQRGCVKVGEGEYEITRYTSCCDLANLIYYYTTYENPAITAVSLKNKDDAELICYPLREKTQIRFEN